MARGFWEQLLAFATLPLCVFCCCGGAQFAQELLDSLMPRIGTALGLFVTSSIVALHALALLGLGLNRGTPVSRASTALFGVATALVLGVGLTCVVMRWSPHSTVERYGGLFGVGIVLIALVILPCQILADRGTRSARVQWRQEAQQRACPGEPISRAEPDSPHA